MFLSEGVIKYKFKIESQVGCGGVDYNPGAWKAGAGLTSSKPGLHWTDA